MCICQRGNRVTRTIGQHPVAKNGGTPPTVAFIQFTERTNHIVAQRYDNGNRKPSAAAKQIQHVSAHVDTKKRSCHYVARGWFLKINLASLYISEFFHIGLPRKSIVLCRGFFVCVYGDTSGARCSIPIENPRFPSDSPLPREKYPCRRHYRPIHCPRRQRNWIRGPYHAIRVVTIWSFHTAIPCADFAAVGAGDITRA